MRPFTISASGRLFQISPDGKKLEPAGSALYKAQNQDVVTPTFESLLENGFWSELEMAGRRAGRTSYQLEFVKRISGNQFAPGVNVRWFQNSNYVTEGSLLNYIVEFDTTGKLVL
jgi:hypothetical protein